MCCGKPKRGIQYAQEEPISASTQRCPIDGSLLMTKLRPQRHLRCVANDHKFRIA